MPSKHKVVIIVIIATIFGLFSGMVGSIIARVYILEDAFKIPLFGELSFSEQQKGSSIIIHNAKKVVVEQNVKIDEVTRSSKESLVWLYEKIKKNDIAKSSKQEGKFDIESHYRADTYLSQGFVLTSDGWIITEFLPKNIAVLLKGVKSTSSKMALSKALEGFVAIDKNENQYEISLVVHDEVSGFTYWKMIATGLPVKKFGLYSEITNGQIVLVINPENQIWLTSISGIVNKREVIEYSDVFDPQLILNEDVKENFFSSFLFDLNGDVMGIIDKEGIVKPISGFVNCINCLLENDEISRPVLGVYYVDLAKYFYNDKNSIKKGALISANKEGVSIDPSSPAKKAGLREGDVIVSVNGRELNHENGLACNINSFKTGDKINIEYIREEKMMQVELVLGGK